MENRYPALKHITNPSDRQREYRIRSELGYYKEKASKFNLDHLNIPNKRDVVPIKLKNSKEHLAMPRAGHHDSFGYYKNPSSTKEQNA